MKEYELIIGVHIAKIAIFGIAKTKPLPNITIGSGFSLIGRKFHIQKKINTEAAETGQLNVKLPVFGIPGFQMPAEILPAGSLHCIDRKVSARPVKALDISPPVSRPL